MNIGSNFEKGVGALEDLYKIGGASIAPLLNRVYYHFFNLENQTQKETLKNIPEVRSFLHRSVVELTRDYMAFTGGHVEFHVDDENYSLEEWNRLLEVLPAVLSTINSFDFEDVIKISFVPSGLVFQGKMTFGNEIKNIREVIYSDLRKILSAKALLTFELVEQQSEIKFFLDISHTQSTVYGINLNDIFGNLILCLPSLFVNYTTLVRTMPDHLVIEINEHLELFKHSKIPDDLSREMEILHFSFLFRPVSIIIPKMGKLLPVDNSRAAGDPGSGNLFEGFTKSGLYYLDLFSLMSK